MVNKLDPRTKLLLVLSISLVIFLYNLPLLDLGVILFLFVVMGWNGLLRQSIRFFIFYCVLMYAEYYILPIAPGFFASLLAIFCLYIKKLIPCMMAAYLLVHTTKVRELIISLRKLHVPECIIIPLAIMMRYFPTIGKDYQNIRKALKLRNVINPIKKCEYICVSLIIAASETAEELSIAAILRGIDSPNRKASLWDVKMGISDYFIISIVVLLLITVIYFRNAGGAV